MGVRILLWGALAAPALAAGAMAQAPAPPVKPQRPHRTGLWIEVGAGPGLLRIGRSSSDRIISANVEGGFLRVGGTISDNVLLSWESGGFNNESFWFGGTDTSIVAEMAYTGIAVMWYPGRTGLFLKGSVGFAQGTFTVPTAARADTLEGNGVGLAIGAGWDWSLSRKYALTVNVASFVTALGDLVLPSERVDDVIGTTYQLMLSFTFR